MIRDAYENPDSSQQIVKARRISLSSANTYDDYYIDDGSLGRKMSRSGYSNGYASDSTDSGYVLSRRSQRRKHRGTSLQSPYVKGYPDTAYEEGIILSNKGSRQRRSSQYAGSRGLRGSSRDVEMWSNGGTSFRNQGYESDSYV